MRIVLLNGPPRSGKDTVAKALRSSGFYHVSLARLLKVRAHLLFGLDVPVYFFEETKDQPRVEFGGATPRQVYIDVSEKVVKPIMGRGIWARWLRKSMDNTEQVVGFFHPSRLKGFVVSDLGFPYEIEPLVRGFDPLIVRLYRPGTSFVNDSREYVSAARVPEMDLHNNGTQEDLERNAVQAVKAYFSEGGA